jgi:hypothetical protein
LNGGEIIEQLFERQGACERHDDSDDWRAPLLDSALLVILTTYHDNKIPNRALLFLLINDLTYSKMCPTNVHTSQAPQSSLPCLRSSHRKKLEIADQGSRIVDHVALVPE